MPIYWEEMNTESDKSIESEENQQLKKLHQIVEETIKEEELIIHNLLHPPEVGNQD